jgi:hypothetical protein
MSAVKVIRALLIASPQVAAIVSDRVYAGVVPQGALPPAIGITEVSNVQVGAFDAQAEFSLVTSRVQVTAMAKDYPSIKSMLDVIRRACNFQRGQIAMVDVVSITRDTVGPDIEDDTGMHFQSIDFKVTYQEQN